MTREQAFSSIEREFSTAEQAMKSGNDGMVRVCARRSAGVAIAFWLQANPRSGWGIDAMSQLRSLAYDDAIVQDVRDAGKRLSVKITEKFTFPFLTNPIDDARIIINYLMEQK